MKTGSTTFNTKRMPEKWRRHFKIYRAKVSIYLDTADFGTPLVVDASEMMDFLPYGIDDPSFVEKAGPVRPGAEALWIEAEVPEGLPSRPNVRRIGAMVHRSKTRTNFMVKAWTGAEHEYWIEIYLRDGDGLSTRLGEDVRFQLDNRGFLTGVALMAYRSVLRPGNPFGDDASSMSAIGRFDVQAGRFDVEDEQTPAVEAVNRVFFVLALLNCRNVTLRERGSGKKKGPGPAGDAFHEVIINGTVRGPGGKGGETVATASGRHHLARGHFKTFTEDAPQLGKHVGTYWWGWQVRGQESPGVIEKTYTLKVGR